MKYSEFEKLMEDKGLYVENKPNIIVVCDEDGAIVSSISKIVTMTLSTDYIYFEVLDEELRRYITQVAMELSFTDLGEREEEEKYYYRLKGFGEEGYLNSEDNGTYLYVADIVQTDECQTQFTDKEFATLPDDIKSHNWEKIKVECED